MNDDSVTAGAEGVSCYTAHADRTSVRLVRSYRLNRSLLRGLREVRLCASGLHRAVSKTRGKKIVFEIKKGGREPAPMHSDWEDHHHAARIQRPDSFTFPRHIQEG